MVFGIYNILEERHKILILKASKLCEILFVAVSSDEEVQTLFGKPSELKLEQRKSNVLHFLQESSIDAKIIGEPNLSPMDVCVKHPPNSYILSESQYERFGKELKNIIEKNKIDAVIEIV